MENHFRVVRFGFRSNAAIFEGPEREVLAWLAHRPGSENIYEVYSDSEDRYFLPLEFIQIYNKKRNEGDAERLRKVSAIRKVVLEALTEQRNGNEALVLIMDEAADKIMALFEK